jgi:hypothetical protein
MMAVEMCAADHLNSTIVSSLIPKEEGSQILYALCFVVILVCFLFLCVCIERVIRLNRVHSSQLNRMSQNVRLFHELDLVQATTSKSGESPSCSAEKNPSASSIYENRLVQAVPTIVHATSSNKILPGHPSERGPVTVKLASHCVCYRATPKCRSAHSESCVCSYFNFEPNTDRLSTCSKSSGCSYFNFGPYSGCPSIHSDYFPYFNRDSVV